MEGAGCRRVMMWKTSTREGPLEEMQPRQEEEGQLVGPRW